MTRIVRSQDLFQGKREVIIEHAKEYYRLLITKSGKLILNK
jgi:hemin uptake protein HemP